MLRLSAVLLCLLAVPGFAQVVSYDGTAFPDDVGWIRGDQPQQYLADRYLDDGWFVQTPEIIEGEPANELDTYRWNLIEQAGPAAWFLEWVMVTDGPPSFGAVAPSAIAAAGQAGIIYHFTIGNDELLFNRGSQFPLVFHSFAPGVHEFRLELRNEPPTGTYVFMMDGEVVDEGAAEGYYPTSDSFVVFGVQADIVDSQTRWDHIEFGPFVPETIPGDWDDDGDVDLLDYRQFEACISVSGLGGAPIGQACLDHFDFDDDSDVDMADFCGFQAAFTGGD